MGPGGAGKGSDSRAAAATSPPDLPARPVPPLRVPIRAPGVPIAPIAPIDPGVLGAPIAPIGPGVSVDPGAPGAALELLP